MLLQDWSAPRHHIGRWSKGWLTHICRFAVTSPHCHDLRAIAVGALGFAALCSHRINSGVIAGIDWLDWAAPPFAPVGGFCRDLLLELLKLSASSELELALLGGALTVVGWAYQAANTRFGVADLFAAEIATLCRVAAVSEFLPRYILLYLDDSRFPPVTPPRDYLAVFNGNAKDLELLDGDVARFVTQFYVHMKALMDTLGRAADPKDGLDHWRDNALTIIYNAFLAFESARQALAVLMEDRQDRREYILTAMLSELPAYILLYDQIQYLDPLRTERIKVRLASYQSLIEGIRADRNRPPPCQQYVPEILELWDEARAPNGTIRLPNALKIPPRERPSRQQSDPRPAGVLPGGPVAERP